MLDLPRKISHSRKRAITTKRAEKFIFDFFMRMHQIRGIAAPESEKGILRAKSRYLARTAVSKFGGKELIDVDPTELTTQQIVEKIAG